MTYPGDPNATQTGKTIDIEQGSEQEIVRGFTVGHIPMVMTVNAGIINLGDDVPDDTLIELTCEVAWGAGQSKSINVSVDVSEATAFTLVANSLDLKIKYAEKRAFAAAAGPKLTVYAYVGLGTRPNGNPPRRTFITETLAARTDENLVRVPKYATNMMLLGISQPIPAIVRMQRTKQAASVLYSYDTTQLTNRESWAMPIVNGVRYVAIVSDSLDPIITPTVSFDLAL